MTLKLHAFAPDRSFDTKTWFLGDLPLFVARNDGKSFRPGWNVYAWSQDDRVTAWLDRNIPVDADGGFRTRREAVRAVEALLAADPLDVPATALTSRRLSAGCHRTTDGHWEVRRDADGRWSLIALTAQAQAAIRVPHRPAQTLFKALVTASVMMEMAADAQWPTLADADSGS